MTGRPVTRLAGLPALAVLLLALAGCGGAAAGEAAEPRPDGRLVLVSGRDDHGELADPTVSAYAAPGSREEVGAIADGTLARVTEIDGTWLHLVTAEGRQVEGWVDDYHLRGVLHLVGPAPSCRAEVAGRAAEAGLQVVASDLRGGRALVSTEDGTVRGWVTRSALHELPPTGPGCEHDEGGHRH